MGLLDTSTLPLSDRLTDRTARPRRPRISTVTLAELSVGPLLTEGDERAARQAHVQRAEADFDPIPFDTEAARAVGRLAASLRRSGRTASSRAFGAMIAAIAIAKGLTLCTCDPGDFEGIVGLHVVPVEVPQ